MSEELDEAVRGNAGEVFEAAREVTDARELNDAARLDDAEAVLKTAKRGPSIAMHQ